MKHPEGKFYVKMDWIGDFGPMYILKGAGGYLTLGHLRNSNGGLDREAEILYFDLFEDAVKKLSKLGHEWREGFNIYKVEKHKNKRCFAWPRTLKGFNNVVRQYNLT